MTEDLHGFTPPAGVPDATTTLHGDRVSLAPLDAARHGDDLYAAAHDARDPLLWRYLAYGPWPDDRAGFDAHLAAQEASSDPRFYAVVLDGGRAVGVVSYLRMDPPNGVIEIGHIWFGAVLQRTPAATEVVYLLARHAFDDLGHRRLEWKCDAANARSQAAARRFGFTFEGIFRQHQIVKGRNRDTAWFSLLDHEWPAARAGFEAWLAPGNFDADGRQHAGLAQLRTAAAAAQA
jgi:RimJ/RimL family protein N-acetyltransferase